MFQKHLLKVVLAVSVSLSLYAISFLPSGAAQVETGIPPVNFSYSTVAQDTPPQPQVLPPNISVYAILPTLIDPDIILSNASLLNGVSAAPLGFNLYNPMYIIFPWMQPSISHAWVNTAFQMNAGKPAYLYAVGNFNPVNFKLPAPGSGPLPALTGIYQFRWVWWDE